MTQELKTKKELTIVKEEKRLTLQEIYEHPASIEVSRSLMHQAFQIPMAGTESTLSTARTKTLKIRYNAHYQMLVGVNQGHYFGSPAPNTIVFHE